MNVHFVATGYGRVSVPFADKTVTEISCHARGTLCCGMSLLVAPDMIERAREVIQSEHAVYHSIVSMENPLQPRRDQYC